METSVKTIALFYQGLKEETSILASQLMSTLRMQGHHVRAIDIQGESQECTSSQFEGCDLSLVLGGDGTIIHAARLAPVSGYPLWGLISDG